jgi:hypothetical protein
MATALVPERNSSRTRTGTAAAAAAAAASMGHLALKRAIRHAEANDLVARNVAALADTPKGQHGRPSKSLTDLHPRPARHHSRRPRAR